MSEAFTIVLVVATVVALVMAWRATVAARSARGVAAAAAGDLEERDRTLREERAVQDRVLSSMREGVLLLGPDGSTAFTNAALDRHLGGHPGSAADLFPVRIREAAARAAVGDPSELEVEVGSPPRWLRVQVVPAGDDGSVLAIVRDVTSQRRLDAVRRDFVANASHELKTPAATIRAVAETLAQAAGDDPGAVPRFAAQLEHEALRLSRIVADLLDLSRLESGSGVAETVHLDALVREECERASDAAEEAGLDLVTETTGPAPIRGSARDLALLARNLLDNAIRYTPGGGRVTVAIENQGNRVSLRVTDTGVGIPSRDLPRIFERFYRVDRARSRETGGTGLGLAIVKHVADNHDGAVEVESELGVGTTVRVAFPRASVP
jgi:two-component system sensor histidine kinase SenX3